MTRHVATTAAAAVTDHNTAIDEARRENNRLRDAAVGDIAFVPKDQQRHVREVIGAAFDAAAFLIAVRLGKKRKRDRKGST